jgi:hypothetical protein
MDDTHHVGYLNIFARLSSTTPCNYAHILDLNTFEENDGEVVTDIILQDAIVTMLHQVSADTLTKFLDATTTFRIVLKVKSKHIDDSLIIMRKDSQVLVSEPTSLRRPLGLTQSS